MPLILLGLISLGALSLAAAVYAFLLERSRRAIVTRSGQLDAPTHSAGMLERPVGFSELVARRVSAALPSDWSSNARTTSALVQAGYDSDAAPLIYATVRVALLIGLPLLLLSVVPKHTLMDVVLYAAMALIVAVILPKFWLVRAVRLRQETIRRSLPDALDLLVVCIEAGISLDAAILRVARELVTVHAVLAGELLGVNRMTNAGMPRGDALRGLWTRTGVEEVRALVSHIVQGEKWGTSSGKVLRVYSETLRRQRRQAAEKKAATAPVTMLLPLTLFIFPAILIVIMGPVAVSVMSLFR